MPLHRGTHCPPLQGPGSRATSSRLPVSPVNSNTGVGFPGASAPKRGSAGKASSAKPLQESSHLTRAILEEFPTALRLYVLILEAADSYRLNLNLSRPAAFIANFVCQFPHEFVPFWAL